MIKLHLRKGLMKSFASTLAVAVLLTIQVFGQYVSAEETVSDGEASRKLIISEENYGSTMKEVVKPYLESFGEKGYFKGKNSANIYYEKYLVDNAKGTIVLSHGFTENLEKFTEITYYFTNMGYSVYGLEHRGHGRSTHLGIDNDQVNVEDFQYYVEDLKTLVDMAKKESGDEKLYLYAHSMGGLIGTRYLECYPNDFDAAILNAPMLGINSGQYPSFVAKLLSSGAAVFGAGDKYVFGQGPYQETYDFGTSSSTTSSKSRYDYYHEIIVNNKDFHLSGASYRWLYESYKACATATSYSQAKKVEIPVLLFQAGNDTYVDNSEQNKFAKNAPNCIIKRYESARHGIYSEQNDILTDYMADVFNFYQKH